MNAEQIEKMKKKVENIEEAAKGIRKVIKVLEKGEGKKIIPGLKYIQCGYALFRDWDADIEKDGLEISLSFLNEKNQLIHFEDIPISIEVKLYAGHFEGIDLVKDRLVYTGTFERSKSLELAVLAGENPIRIPAEEIEADPSKDFPFGVIEVRVTTPEQGEFATRDQARLYRKKGDTIP